MAILDRTKIAALPTYEVVPAHLTDEACIAMGVSFNPSSMATVDRIKILSAALFDVLSMQKSMKPDAGREFALAITNLQQAQMWGVKAATLGL